MSRQEAPVLLTTAEVAELLRKTPNAVTVARLRGEAPASFGFKVGRTIRYRREDVYGWLDKQAEQAGR